MKVYIFVLLICLRAVKNFGVFADPVMGACLRGSAAIKATSSQAAPLFPPPPLHSSERRSPACRCLRAHSCSSSSSPSHRSWGAVASSRWEFWLLNRSWLLRKSSRRQPQLCCDVFRRTTTTQMDYILCSAWTRKDNLRTLFSAGRSVSAAGWWCAAE